MKNLALCLLALYAFHANADDATFRRTDTYLNVGWTIAPKHSVDASLNGVSASSQGSDDSGITIGVDQIFRFSPYFGISSVGEYVNSPSSNGAADNLIFFGIGPRGAIPLGDFELWGSALVGLGIDFFGDTNHQTGNVLLSLSSSNSLAFEFSPRIGADFSLNQLVKLRLQISYSMASFPYSFDARNATTLSYLGSGSGKGDLTWLAASIGIALEF